METIKIPTGYIFMDDYYNMGMDVYECDKITCEDITSKANRSWIDKLLSN